MSKRDAVAAVLVDYLPMANPETTTEIAERILKAIEDEERSARLAELNSGDKSKHLSVWA